MGRFPALVLSASLLGGIALTGLSTPTDAAGKKPQGKLVFVTSTLQTGNLGGLTGADMICQARAAAGGLRGIFKAWLSDTTASPSTRFTRSKKPYVLLDGTVIANNWADLTDGS